VVVRFGAPYSAQAVTEQFGNRNIPRLLDVVFVSLKVYAPVVAGVNVNIFSGPLSSHAAHT
jgi:hypothetical protein